MAFREAKPLAGMTLVETMIVLVIIGFVIEMAAPGTGAFAIGGTLALLLLIRI